MARVETNVMMDRLIDAVGEAGRLLNRLHALLPEQENSGPDTGTIGRHAPESSEPWAKQAGAAYWDIYFGARTILFAMRYEAGVRRSSEQVYGHDALASIRNYAPRASDLTLRGATRTLERLVRAGHAVPDVDQDEQWAPLPAAPGRPPLACPYCRTYGLRMLRRKGEVRCIYPGCADADGNPTRARMEHGRMTGEERLVFGDGTTMGGAA